MTNVHRTLLSYIFLYIKNAVNESDRDSRSDEKSESFFFFKEGDKMEGNEERQERENKNKQQTKTKQQTKKIKLKSKMNLTTSRSRT